MKINKKIHVLSEHEYLSSNSRCLLSREMLLLLSYENKTHQIKPSLFIYKIADYYHVKCISIMQCVSPHTYVYIRIK